MINHISDDLHHIHLLALTNFPLAILVICDVTYIIISLEYARRAFCERRMVAWDGLSYYCKERPMRSRTNLLVSRSSTRCRPPRGELYVACHLNEQYCTATCAYHALAFSRLRATEAVFRLVRVQLDRASAQLQQISIPTACAKRAAPTTP